MKIRIVQEVSLVERQGQEIIGYASPVTCECCGTICRVRFFEMTNGAKFGSECAKLFTLLTQHTTYDPRIDFWAETLRANRKQLAYIAALGGTK